jgi:2',3'-cyclic-nucleotide 2'-phosphodiesterase (5'-nucleotidase family)
MRVVRILLLSVLLLSQCLLSSSCSSAGGSNEPREFTIALSGYLMGQVGPCKCPGHPIGGHTRRATVMQNETDPDDGLLILDAGKWVNLDQDIGERDSRITAAVLAELGVQAVNVTMRDARLGKEMLLELKKEYDLPFLSANLTDTTNHKPLFPASETFRVNFKDGGSLDVAVIGICRAGSNNYMPPETGLEFVNPDEVLLKAYKKVMNEPCVIVLCDADRSVAADWLGMLETETGSRPDMILSSNMHPVRTQRILIGQTPMTTAGRQGKYLDLVHAFPLDQGGWDVRKTGFELSDEVADDPHIAELVAELTAAITTSDN